MKTVNKTNYKNYQEKFIEENTKIRILKDIK